MKNKDWMKPPLDELTKNFIDDVHETLTRGAIEDYTVTPARLVPIHDLPDKERVQVVGDITYQRWRRQYRLEGLPMETANRILNNALDGRPKEEWLKPTAHEMERERGGRGGQ